MNKKYKRTLYGGYLAYFCQAIGNNMLPLLFVTFQEQFDFSLELLAFLVTLNFGFQIFVDAFSAPIIRKFGYRASVLLAHGAMTLGLVFLGTLPYIMNPYGGIVISVLLFAFGSGLLEVVVSPMIEALPTDDKSGSMSLLHSFYCWGHVAIVLISTLFFVLFDIHNWRFLAFFWALIPFANLFILAKAPIRVLESDENPVPLITLLKNKVFWILLVLMICAGASEQAMAQWSSYFAESGLKVSKTMGDLLGPCLFAVLMGTSRVFYGKFSDRISLKKFIAGSSVLSIFSYLLAVLAPHPVLSLAGCALAGLAAGIMWPGIYSLGATNCPEGGSFMFALLALGGDLGCTSGPTIVGNVASFFNDNIKIGLAVACIFPILLLFGVRLLKKDS